ncbi:MAG: Xaa-Pro peptidase family protein [Acidimicrobiales bacterium]|nr:Xaa-Pro peptidase family protein [Acidimicrobiales bacterium]
MERSARFDRVRREISRHRADALLVTKLVNLRWLTGFSGSAGMLLILPRRSVLITDGRYRESASAELADARVDAELAVTSAPGEVLSELTREEELGCVAAEADDLSWASAQVADASWFPDAELVPTTGLIESLREVKESAEIARAEAAAGIADAALAEVVPMLRAGATEVEVAVALESAMRRLGAEEPAFDTIVASGPNSAVPHHRPTGRVIEQGDLVVIDMGATVDGYRSDMTRTFVIGEPSDTAGRLLEVVAAAQAAGVEEVVAGRPCRDVDAAARRVVAEAGWAEAFVHPTGHGVGLEIHERLRLAATSDDTLAVGHVVTVEPGVYLPGFGGVRIEDTVEVTGTGCRRLTRSSHHTVLG